MPALAVSGLSELLGGRVRPALEAAGIDALVNVTVDGAARRDRAPSALATVDSTRRLLAAASAARVSALVHVSTAAVYGAWPDNPVPITEQAPLRPNPGLTEAVAHAEAERLVADWAADHPDARVVVLRPVAVLAPGTQDWLGLPVRVGDSDPPRQFLHMDDLVSAVGLAATAPLRGPFNVTPDGWIAGDVVRDLSSGRPPLPLPRRLAVTAVTFAWKTRLSNASPRLLPLVRHPWVVANDRLRAAGWEPRYSNEEALVAGRRPSFWREMSPARRQQVSLGVAGAVLAGLVGGGAAVVVRLRRS